MKSTLDELDDVKNTLERVQHSLAGIYATLWNHSVERRKHMWRARYAVFIGWGVAVVGWGCFFAELFSNGG